MLTATAALAAGKPPVPDLTAGGTRDNKSDWTLGPTGARGWIWGWRGQTTGARQILVTSVAPSSPAEGVLEKGDVILGVGGKAFAEDARIVFARAIAAAETAEGRGILRLLRWRDGKMSNVEMRLAVLGAYNATAPYDCEKSRLILAQGCRAIAKKGLDRVSIPNDLNALALLASGDDTYRDLAAKYARLVAEYQPGGLECWHYAYATLFLAEYAAATSDAAVRPGLKRLALDIARGQSRVGTWGHRFARADGILNGYGAMNQPGLILTLAMVVAREAGVRDPQLDRAVQKSAAFLRWFVNKGAIPYGDHPPWPWHDDNGKCSSAAVLYDLLGDREASTFFAKMALAAHGERESGHTGNYFNVLWAMPGASRCGPTATGAYLAEHAWYYDLARGWNGSFVYQNTPGHWGGASYRKWDSTGAFLLAYALPEKRLYITGRRPSAVRPLRSAEAADVIDAGRDFSFWTEKTCYDHRTTDRLFAGLASWSPAVRKRSARALGSRDGDFVPRLLKMLGSGSRDAQYGACEALAFLGPRADGAAPKVRRLLNAADPWLVTLAVDALVRMGPEVRKAIVPELLSLTVRHNPSDPRRLIQRATCSALFSPMPGRREPKSTLAESLTGVDRELLYPAVKSVLENENGGTRGLLRRLYGKLDDRDLAHLLPAIVKAVREQAPSNQMFCDSIRLAGLDLLSRLRIREGMELCVDVLEPERWGAGRRIPKCLDYLKRYGTHAQLLIPQLQLARATQVRKARRKGDKHPVVVAIDKAIAQIRAADTSPTLLTLNDFVTSAGG